MEHSQIEYFPIAYYSCVKTPLSIRIRKIPSECYIVRVGINRRKSYQISECVLTSTMRICSNKVACTLAIRLIVIVGVSIVIIVVIIRRICAAIVCY